MKTLNRGILTAKNINLSERELRMLKNFNYPMQVHNEPQGVPILKVILIVIAFSAMSASYAYSVRPAPIVITKIEKVPVDRPVPTEKLVPACETPLSLSKHTHYRGWIEQLAEAVPETALRNHK